MEDVEKGIEFCRYYGILPIGDFEDCGEIDLNDEIIVHYLGFYRRFCFIICTKVIFNIRNIWFLILADGVFNTMFFKI